MEKVKSSLNVKTITKKIIWTKLIRTVWLLIGLGLPTWEHEASPTIKYKENKHATNISRFLPIRGNSSLKAVIMASEPPNCEKKETIVERHIFRQSTYMFSD